MVFCQLSNPCEKQVYDDIDIFIFFHFLCCHWSSIALWMPVFYYTIVFDGWMAKFISLEIVFYEPNLSWEIITKTSSQVGLENTTNMDRIIKLRIL